VRRLLSLALAATAGVLFGAGLLLSGMTRPATVIGFLDVGGGWDPTLGFVMAGAVTVYAVAFVAIRRQLREPYFGEAFHLPTRRDLDATLVLGASMFGVGWGLAGVCPGPSIVAAASGRATALGFVIAMMIGMAIHDRAISAMASRAARHREG
jgi:uncharacterized membrane protein YedE/YeeE